MKWKQARKPLLFDHSSIITEKGKVIWYVAIARYMRG